MPRRTSGGSERISTSLKNTIIRDRRTQKKVEMQLWPRRKEKESIEN
jgi:hypothetical protein